MIRVGGVGGKKRRKYTMKAPMCLLRYHMPRKNFYVSRKEEELEGEGGAGWRGKIQETDTVKKFVAPCRSKEKKIKKKEDRNTKNFFLRDWKLPERSGGVQKKNDFADPEAVDFDPRDRGSATSTFPVHRFFVG